MMPMTNIIYNQNSKLEFSDDIISHNFSISLLFRKTCRVQTVFMTRGRNQPIRVYISFAAVLLNIIFDNGSRIKSKLPLKVNSNLSVCPISSFTKVWEHLDYIYNHISQSKKIKHFILVPIYVVPSPETDGKR